jgi:hypothetical protein
MQLVERLLDRKFVMAADFQILVANPTKYETADSIILRRSRLACQILINVVVRRLRGRSVHITLCDRIAGDVPHRVLICAHVPHRAPIQYPSSSFPYPGPSGCIPVQCSTSRPSHPMIVLEHIFTVPCGPIEGNINSTIWPGLGSAPQTKPSPYLCRYGQGALR